MKNKIDSDMLAIVGLAILGCVLIASAYLSDESPKTEKSKKE